MAIITSTNLLASHSLYTIVLAYLLLTTPQTLVQTNLIRTLGISLRLPLASPSSLSLHPITHTSSPTPAIHSTLSTFSAEDHPLDPFAAPNTATALAALLLAFYALNDALGTSLPEPCFGVYWATQAIVRLAVLFALEAWIYLSKPAPPLLDTGAAGEAAASQLGGSWGACLKTDVVFTWAFVELVWMFWIFYALREEGRQNASRKQDARKRAEELNGL